MRHAAHTVCSQGLLQSARAYSHVSPVLIPGDAVTVVFVHGEVGRPGRHPLITAPRGNLCLWSQEQAKRCGKSALGVAVDVPTRPQYRPRLLMRSTLLRRYYMRRVS